MSILPNLTLKDQENLQALDTENPSINPKIEAVTRKSPDLRIINFTAELEEVDRTFQAIAQTYKSVWERRAVLDWEAASYKLPKAEFRKLFQLWAENQSNI